MASFFAMVTENLPIGLLRTMKDSLHASADQIGNSVSVYALVVAVSSAPLTSLTSRFDRKHVLLASFGIYGVCCVATACAGNYLQLMGARFVGGLSHGVFWAIIAVYASRLSTPEQANKNLAMTYAGSSLGMALGVPLATALGQQYGWRIPFVVAGIALFVLTAAGWYFLVPSVPEKIHKSDPHHVPLYAIRGLIPLIAMVGFVMLGQFTIFTYITEFFTSRGISESMSTVLLFLIGVAGIGGVWIASRPSQRSLTSRVQRTTLLLLIIIGLVYECPAQFFLLTVLLVLWGIVFSMLPLMLQPIAIALGEKRADVVSALYVGIYSLGIGGGAIVGGQLIRLPGSNAAADAGTPGVGYLIPVAMGLIIVGLVCSRRIPHQIG